MRRTDIASVTAAAVTAAAVTAAALAAPSALAGQPPGASFAGGDSTMVDRVAAVVGDSVILLTEVQAQVISLTQQGQEVTPDQVLSQLVDRQVVLQAAARDTTLAIPEDEVDRRLDEAMQGVRSQFPTEDAYQQALEQQGLTPAALREARRQQIRTQLLESIYMSRQLQSAAPVAVSEAEMRALFEDQRANLQERPELLTFQQVLVPIRATGEAWARAQALADSLHGEIQGGADFEALAREHSQDQSTASGGGDLGWFRRGQMVRDFEAVAFGQRPGTVSPPVRTGYGWHLIYTERLRPGEVKARHILIRPEVTETDRQVAMQRAEEVAEAARAGEDLQEVTRPTAGDDQPEEFDEFQRSRGDLSSFEEPGFAENLAGVGEGDVAGPFRTTVGNGEFFAVVRVEEVREAGDFTFEDVRDQIRTRLAEQKKAQRLLERLRAGTYIDIRM